MDTSSSGVQQASSSSSYGLEHLPSSFDAAAWANSVMTIGTMRKLLNASVPVHNCVRANKTEVLSDADNDDP